MREAKSSSRSSGKKRMRCYFASLARWDTQQKGMGKLERRCQGLMLEVDLSSERQEVLAGLLEDKSRLQSKATTGKYYETIFEKIREVGKRKSRKKPWFSCRKTTFCHDVKVKGEKNENVA